jgi:hypothetical protein
MVIAASAHQNVRPVATATAPSTMLNTLVLPPNQKASWCQGLPRRAASGMRSMWRVST